MPNPYQPPREGKTGLFRFLKQFADLYPKANRELDEDDHREWWYPRRTRKSAVIAVLSLVTLFALFFALGGIPALCFVAGVIFLFGTCNALLVIILTIAPSDHRRMRREREEDIK